MSQHDPKPLREKSRPTSTTVGPNPGNPESLSESKALPLEWLLNPAKGKAPSDRILARLVVFEAREPNPHLRDDYRQAFITVSFAAKGHPYPFVEASYVMYGLHPDKLYPSILARRSALLGPGGEALMAHTPSLPASPKKPVRSAAKPRKEEAA